MNVGCWVEAEAQKWDHQGRHEEAGKLGTAPVKGAKDEAEADRGGFGRPGQTSRQERGMIQASL